MRGAWQGRGGRATDSATTDVSGLWAGSLPLQQAPGGYPPALHAGVSAVLSASAATGPTGVLPAGLSTADLPAAGAHARIRTSCNASTLSCARARQPPAWTAGAAHQPLGSLIDHSPSTSLGARDGRPHGARGLTAGLHPVVTSLPTWYRWESSRRSARSTTSRSWGRT